MKMKLRSALICAVIVSTAFYLWGEEPETIEIDSTPTIQWPLESTAAVPVSDLRFEPMTYVGTETWSDSTYWLGPETWCRVGNGWQHPSETAASVRSFRVPRDGTVEISGSAAKKHIAPETDGVEVSIWLDSETLWRASIDGGDERGWNFLLRLPVVSGSVVRFVVGCRGSISCDTTAFDPTIRYLDGTREKFTASENFPEGEASDGPWFCESMPNEPAFERQLSENDAADFSAMIRCEWLRDDKIPPAAAWDVYLDAAKKHLAAAETLLDDLYDSLGERQATEFSASIETLRAALTDCRDARSAETVYAKVRGLKRKIALANPLMNFGKMLFVKRVPASYSHLVMQYFGWRARPGGGIFVLENPGRSLECRDLFDGKFAAGNILEPRLSFDAQRLVFSFVDLSAGKTYDPYKVHFTDSDDGFYHVWTANIDGSDARQITDGSFDDITPNWLPDGRIVFSSTRRKGCARCFWWGFGLRWHVYTIHSMNADGSGIQTLSWHDTNEWFPEVSNSGDIVYARWDYIDRDAVTHQNFWAMRPDGTNPRAVWGNATPKPHCTFQAKPIPQSGKYLFTASAHHSITAGPLVLLDPSVGVDGQEPLERVTPNLAFPEAESTDIKEYYESPQPLSEKYYLTSYSPWKLHWEGQEPNRENALGIYLLDRFGNRELIYRDPSVGATNATPIAVRPAPPILASQLPTNPPDSGEMTVTDVYQGLGPNVERGSIKELRIVQIFPKTTRDSDLPPIGMAREENGRAILGTVPVEADGSAHFRVPARAPFCLQAIDANGFAYQTMRSLTYVQPGEKISCTGCHEGRETSAYAAAQTSASGTRPSAALRAASEIAPGELGGRPFSYVETVQPIWDAKCVECHNEQRADGGFDLTGRPKGEGKDAFTQSYSALMGDVDFWGTGTNPENAARALIPRFGARNQIQMTAPGGQYGALGSRLLKLLRNGHEGVELSDSQWRALAAWIDLNAIFYGVDSPAEQKKILAGQRADMPEIQ